MEEIELECIDGTRFVPNAETGIIDDHQYRGNVDIRRLWIPNTISKIGKFAFYGCPNLTEIIFEDGGELPLTIALMAFSKCDNLINVVLPGRLTGLGAGCFRDCGMLTKLTVGEGNQMLSIGEHLFDNCPCAVEMRKVVEDEKKRRDVLLPSENITNQRDGRKRKANNLLETFREKNMLGRNLDNDSFRNGLSTVYERIVHDNDFSFAQYYEGYREACEWFSGVGDWRKATPFQVREIVCGTKAKSVAGLDFGKIIQDEYDLAAKKCLPEILEAIRELEGNDDEYETICELENKFTEMFRVPMPNRGRRENGTNHRAAFYRIVAALHPELVVPVPTIARLSPLYEWLTGENSNGNNWYRVSRVVRNRINELLLGKDVFQIGVFAWYLASAFSDFNSEKVASRGRKVLAWLREQGVIGE